MLIDIPTIKHMRKCYGSANQQHKEFSAEDSIGPKQYAVQAIVYENEC